ncbi:hypothetical protein INR49_022590 [Caranx melampygus]|nr:hypothetical protein INR49_022590 [Caranx melampygus]
MCPVTATAWQPPHTPSFSSPSPPLHRLSETANQGEERATTVLSSGYGTLSAWDTGLEPAGSPGEDEDSSQGREKHHWSTTFQENTETTVMGCQQDFSEERTLGVEELNPLPTFDLVGPEAETQVQEKQSRTSFVPGPEYQELPRSSRQNPLESTDSQDQHRAAGPSSSSVPLRRSDSLMSEASGLTYWRLNESDLYRPLPDSFDSSAYPLLQEAPVSPTPSQERGLSLREIYQNKQRTESRRSDCEGSVTSSPSSPQVLTLDPAANTRQSDRTSGFTSPSHFSSPSFTTQPLLYPRVETPVTPDSMVEGSHNPGDTDCNSDTSSVSVAGPSPSKAQTLWGKASQAVLSTSQGRNHAASQQHRGSEEEEVEGEGSHTHTSTLKPCSASQRPRVGSHVEKASSLEDPVVLSLLRQNLREKHSRHVADLKAYYECEIQILRDKLKLRDLPQDLEKSNQALTERCKHLEKALAEATSRVQELEVTNSTLEKKLAEWPERYAVAGATVKSLQQRLEESKRSGKEKDALTARLKSRVRQLEEAAQKSCREADEKEARREREYKMLQDLLGEYDSLMKEHEGVKNNLVSAENKLVDANDQISELKRVISKLESQVKQLEHENQARARYSSHSSTQPSGAGLFHHPDLLLSPSKSKVDPDVTRRKSPCSPSDQLNGSSSGGNGGGRKSQFSQTNHKRSLYTISDQSPGPGSSVDVSSTSGSWRCGSPPECEQVLPQTRHQEQSQSQREAARRDSTVAMTPMMRALIELEETRATESRAPCKNSSPPPPHCMNQLNHQIQIQVSVHMCFDAGSTEGRQTLVKTDNQWIGSQRTTVGFMERRHKETMQERVGLQPERDVVKPGGGAERSAAGGGGGGGGRSQGGVERAAGLLTAQRSLSPEGHRSSSLPPPAQRNIPATTPTKRETLLTPLSAKSSPKRCPTENYSTAFGHQMPREEHLLKSSSPRKRLQFVSADREDDLHQQDASGSVNPPEGAPQLGWEEQGACRGAEPHDVLEESAPLFLDKLHSLAEAEKLFDELTQEKLQIEAALSRMPGAGSSRVSLQSRLDEVRASTY